MFVLFKLVVFAVSCEGADSGDAVAVIAVQGCKEKKKTRISMKWTLDGIKSMSRDRELT